MGSTGVKGTVIYVLAHSQIKNLTELCKYAPSFGLALIPHYFYTLLTTVSISVLSFFSTNSIAFLNP